MQKVHQQAAAGFSQALKPKPASSERARSLAASVARFSRISITRISFISAAAIDVGGGNSSVRRRAAVHPRASALHGSTGSMRKTFPHQAHMPGKRCAWRCRVECSGPLPLNRRAPVTLAGMSPLTCSLFDITEGRDSKQPLPDESLILYTHSLCPFAQRAWMALVEKEVKHTCVQIDLANKPGWYQHVNPRGLVPCVAYRGEIHVESVDICRWIDDNLEGPALVPSDPEARSAADAILADTSAIVGSGMDLVAAQGGRSWGVGSNATPSQISRFERHRARLEECIAMSAGPFVCGNEPGLADIVLWPFMWRFLVCASAFSGYSVAPDGGKLAAWYAAMLRCASVKVTTPNEQEFLEAVRTHKSLDFFDYSSYDFAELHAHLR